jgi:hypothetical protein
MARSPITRRDDAALPHEAVPIPARGFVTPAPEQHQYDDGQDGNTTPNGGR